MLKILILVLALFSQLTYAHDNLSDEFHLIKLIGKENIRFLLKNILEVATVLPAGAIIQYPKDNLPVNYDYRDSNGSVLRSSSGFFPKVQIVSVPPENEDKFPPDVIAKLNKMVNGLFVTSSLLPDSSNQGVFQALKAGSVNADYLSFFNEMGQAKYNYSAYFLKRFGAILNHTVDSETISARDKIKWESIYEELKSAGNREIETPKDYLFTSVELANKYTIEFETTGVTRPKGGWTMAVESTAVRHGFPNVPCAEFMSEMIREAYNRAGYDFREDFNNTKNNYLIWNQTAAVINLANALQKAGWIPWELSKYVPPTGAIMMHEQATSPGHTYMVAGDNGRFIVDNGSPAGRDLRKTSKKIIDLMFKGGVFFLPPTIIPVLF